MSSFAIKIRCGLFFTSIMRVTRFPFREWFTRRPSLLLSAVASTLKKFLIINFAFFQINFFVILKKWLFTNIFGFDSQSSTCNNQCFGLENIRHPFFWQLARQLTLPRTQQQIHPFWTPVWSQFLDLYQGKFSPENIKSKWIICSMKKVYFIFKIIL